MYTPPKIPSGIAIAEERQTSMAVPSMALPIPGVVEMGCR